MIRLQDSTPSIYYTESRDFQFIGRLYDIVLNSIKTNADNLYNIPINENMDEKLLNLLSLTLGFQSKHHYNSKQLMALCSVLPEVLKSKGSLKAITTAVNALLQAEGIKQSLDHTIVPKKEIVLYLSQYLSDLNLLKDLLTYILPAGIGCSMVKELSARTNITTELTTEDVVNVYQDKTDTELGQVLQIRDAAVRANMLDAPRDTSGILVNTTVQSMGLSELQPPEVSLSGHELTISGADEADAFEVYADGKLYKTVKNTNN